MNPAEGIKHQRGCSGQFEKRVIQLVRVAALQCSGGPLAARLRGGFGASQEQEQGGARQAYHRNRPATLRS